MVSVTFVARVADGLLLTETWDSQSERTMEEYKPQAKQLLRRLRNAPSQCSVDSGTMTFHYICVNGVVFMTLCPRQFPKKMAFTFLEEISHAFQDELQREFGTAAGVDYRSRIETIEKPYYFVKFDRVIERKRQDFRDPQSQKALSKVNESLLEVNAIVKKSLEEMMQRGENLEDVNRRAESLRESSKNFAGMAKKLNFQLMMQKYGMLGAIGAFILLVVFLKLRGC